ncbi:MAG: tetratricopeptide repeat protein [Prevotellamassilia sp.]|jgi:TolA-binding protein|nr:tetratricopeptide repeat protein [Prevotellamassilia sp.]
MSTQKKEQSLDVNETLAKSEAFVIKYKKQIITALVAAVIGVGGTLAYIYGYAKPREEKAQELLGVVMQKYVMTQDFEHALKGEGKTLGLIAIADKYSSTDAGNIAKYEAGICNFNLGKTKEAIKYLEDFSAQDDATVSAQALYALGNCYATDKQFDKAVSTFKKAAEATSVPALCAEYLFQAGLILENQKKNNEALEVYQNIKKQYPTAPMCAQQEQNGVLLDAVIDKYIERLSK